MQRYNLFLKTKCLKVKIIEIIIIAFIIIAKMIKIFLVAKNLLCT